jgi:plastocyanin
MFLWLTNKYQSRMYKNILILFIVILAPSVYAHEGEPSHGGDLPVDLGSNRMQYQGMKKLSDISIHKNTFDPDELSVNIGAIIAIKNTDTVEHRLVFDMGEEDEEEHDHPTGGHERSYIIKPERYWVLEFLVPGLFVYKCSTHGETGQIYVRY